MNDPPRPTLALSAVLAAATVLAFQLAAGPAIGAPMDTLRTSARSYAAFGLSVLGADSSVTHVLSSLGAPDPAAWRLFTWSPLAQAYSEAPTAVPSFERGRGYWLITRDPQTLYTLGDTLARDTIDIPLTRGPSGRAGWNQLANPFPYTVNAADWAVLKDDSLARLGASADRFTDHVAGVRSGLPPYSATTTIPRNATFWLRTVDPDTSARWIRWRVPTASAPSGVLMKCDRIGDIHIVYGSGGQLYYVRRHHHSWSTEPIFSGYQATLLSLEVDRLLRPVIAYTTGTVPDETLSYATRTSSGWTEQSLSGVPSSDIPAASLAVDQNNNVRLCYWDKAAYLVRYVYRVGGGPGWSVEDVLTNDHADYDKAPRLQLDSNDEPHVLFVLGGDGTATFPYYVSRSGGVWSSELIPIAERIEWAPAFCLDSHNIPHVMFRDVLSSGDLAYATKSAGVWRYETVLPGANFQYTYAFALDANDRPVCAITDRLAGGAVSYLHRDSGVWKADTIATGIAGSACVGMAIPNAGSPVAAVVEGGSYLLSLYEYSNGAVTLQIPPTRATGASSPLASGNAPDRVDWTLVISAEQNGRASSPLVLGSARSAARTPNALALARVPSPPDADLLELYVTHTDWGHLSGDYVTDFQPPAALMSWPVTLAGAKAPGQVLLRIAGDRLPADAHVWLQDPATGAQYEVPIHEAAFVEATPGPRPLTLTITRNAAEPASAHRTSQEFVHSYPEPFRREVGMVFVLSQPSDVRAAIFDLRGRRIRILQHKTAPAGEQVLMWDGSDERGEATPAGVYFVCYSVGGTSGTTRVVKLD